MLSGLKTSEVFRQNWKLVQELDLAGAWYWNLMRKFRGQLADVRVPRMQEETLDMKHGGKGV